jgi:hypothetical protein
MDIYSTRTGLCRSCRFVPFRTVQTAIQLYLLKVSGRSLDGYHCVPCRSVPFRAVPCRSVRSVSFVSFHFVYSTNGILFE